MNHIIRLRIIAVGLIGTSLIAGCQTPPDNMPPPSAQIGRYPAGSGVSNSSFNEYPRHSTGSATAGPAAPTTSESSR